MRSAVMLLCLAVLAGYSPMLRAETPDRLLSAAELDRGLAFGRNGAARLRQAVGVALPTGDHVTVMVFGGLMSSRAIGTVTRAADGRLMIETIDTGFDYGRMVETPPERVFVPLDGERAKQLEALLDDPALFAEPAGLTGVCTDQPVVGVEIRWQGRSRDAVRLACTLVDRTWQVMDLVVPPGMPPERSSIKPASPSETTPP